MPNTASISRAKIEAAKERLKPFPGTFTSRLLITVAFATPFLVLSAITFSMGGMTQHTYSPNNALLLTLEQLHREGISSTWIATMFPPISLMLAEVASLFPGFQQLILAFMGSFLMGSLILGLMAILRQKRVPFYLRLCLIGIVVISPIFYWQAIYNLPAVLGFTLFAIGLAHTVRFVQWGGTYNGFIAGLLFAGAVLSNNIAALYVVMAILVVITFQWFHVRKLSSVLGMILVLVHPTLLGIATLATISWVMRQDPWAFLQSIGDITDYSRLERVITQSPLSQNAGAGFEWFSLGPLTGLDGIISLLPVIFMSVLNRGLRTKILLVVMGIAFVVAQVYVRQFPIPFPAGINLITITVMAIVMMPEQRNTRFNIGVVAACVMQLGIGWLIVLTRPDTLLAWFEVLAGGAL